MDDAISAGVAATDGVAVGPTMDDRTDTPSRRNTPAIATREELLAAEDELLFLEVRPAAFACIWVAMLALHVACGLFLALQARLYVYLASPRLAYYVHFIEFGIAAKYKAFAAVFGVMSLIHWNVVLRLCLCSLRQRKLAFLPVHGHIHPVDHEDHHDDPSLTWRHLRWWSRRVRRLRLALFARRGVFGVESRFFYPYFYLREVIELTSQIYQANRASVLVGQAWLANLFVTVIAVNCLITPLIQVRFKRRLALRRALLLATDAALDFVIAIVVPVAIFAPYALLFDPKTDTFPVAKTRDETWFVNAVLENQEVFAVSVLDMCFKLVPHVSITGALRKVRALVHKDTSVLSSTHGKVFDGVESPAYRAKHFQLRVAAFEATQHDCEVRKELAVESQLGQTSPTKRVIYHYARVASHAASRATHKYANKLARLVFVAVGVAVVFCQLFAYRNESNALEADAAGCRQPMRPWFATKLACSVYELDCAALGITGAQQDVAARLELLYAGAVVGLVFANCPALEVPPELARFSHLVLLDVYNSTVASWPSGQAALSNARHPKLSTLSFVRVDFADARLPDGLLQSSDFPRGLTDFELVVSNLATLPSDISSTWPPLHKLMLEHTHLDHVPEVLAGWEITELSLAGNAIPTLPDAFVTGISAHAPTVLALSGNLLAALPSGEASWLQSGGRLYIEHTNVSALPDGLRDADGDRQVFAAGSPVCKSAQDREWVECEPHDGDELGLVPLAYIDALYALA